MFDRLRSQMFRREQSSVGTALKRDGASSTVKSAACPTRRCPDRCRISGVDIGAAVEPAIGWDHLGRGVDEARKLIRADPIMIATTKYPVLRQIGPTFIASFTLGAVPACYALARAVTIMRDLHLCRLRKLPADAPIGFIRQGWHRAIGRGTPDRRTYELCVLVELRDWLRAGDMWV